MLRFHHTPIITAGTLIIASLIPLWIAYNYPIFLNDDSYITLTYAKNISSGQGFVFNDSPPTLGTTTPLFVLAVAALATVLPFLEIPIIAVYFTSFCWLGAVWLIFLFRQSWNLSEYQAVIVGLVLIAGGFASFLGMEAYLFAFLLVLSLTLFYSKEYFWAGLASGLLFLARGEGLLILPVMVLFSIIPKFVQRRSLEFELIKPSFYLVVGFTLPVLLWFVYSYFTFGHFLPNTLDAKQAQGQSGMWRSLPQRLIQEWIPFWGNRFRVFESSILNWWWFLIVTGLWFSIVKKRKWLIFIIWIAFYIGGYTFLQVAAYWWYQLPILFVLLIFFALGMAQLINWFMRFSPTRALGVAVSIGLVAFSLFTLSKPLHNFLDYSGDPRGESYIELSNWFNENTQSSESIAFIEIGYLGFYTDNRIIDLAGLVTPDITPHIAEGDFAWGFWHYEPDYYIYLPDFDWALSAIRANPNFNNLYEPVATLPGPRETDFTIYRHLGTD